MLKIRKGVYSEHKSGPIGASERSGPYFGAPIGIMDGHSDMKLRVWDLSDPITTATLVGAPAAGINGWTFTDIGASAAARFRVESTLSSSALCMDSGTADATGINLQYLLGTGTDYFHAMKGAFWGGTPSGLLGPTGGSVIFNYRVGFTTSTSTFTLGCASMFGISASDTTLLDTGGLNTANQPNALFYFNSSGVWGVSGTTGQNITQLASAIVPGTINAGPYNMYSIRLEKAPSVSTAFTSVQFYINGVLKATHTTTPPGNSTYQLSFATTCPAGVDNVRTYFDHISYAHTRLGYPSP